ncbi:MAG TPA: amino acid adenylation domain-containing protein [Polyangiales bacterium]
MPNPLFELDFVPGAGPGVLDHSRVCGRPVLSLGTGLELVLGALQLSTEVRELRLRHVRVLGPVVLDAPCTLRVALLPDERRFVVSCLRPASAQDPNVLEQVYLLGDFELTPGVAELPLDAGGQSPGSLRVPVELTPEREQEQGYVVHPWVLDACIETLQAVAARQSPSPHEGMRTCIVHVESLRVGQAGKPAHSAAWPTTSAPTTTSAAALLDADGEVLIALDGVLCLACTNVEHETIERATHHLTALASDVFVGRTLRPDDNLVEQGVSSLDLVRFLNAVQAELGVSLELKHALQAPSLRAMAQLYTAPAGEQPYEVESSLQSVPDLGPERGGQASFGQEQLWVLERVGDLGPAYHEAVALCLPLGFDLAALKRSLQLLADRHDALRSFFSSDAGGVRLGFDPELPVLLECLPADQVGDRERDASIDALCRTLCRRPYDLTRGPLWRVTLIPTAGSTWVLFEAHHAVVDGWSFERVLLPELAQIYSSVVSGVACLLPAVRPYQAFVSRERQQLHKRQASGELAWWRAKLQDVPALLALPLDMPRPARIAYAGRVVAVPLPKALMQSVTGLARQEGATLFATLLAGYQLLLCRYARQSRFCVGVVTANRGVASHESIVGLCANMLPLRADVGPDDRVSELIERVNVRVHELLERQSDPFSAVVTECAVSRDPRYSPLVQVIFALEQEPDALAFGNAQARMLPVHSGSSKFDLTLAVRLASDGSATASFEYRTDLFHDATVTSMGQSLARVLQSMVQQRDGQVRDVALTGGASDAQLAALSHGPSTPLAERHIHQLFEAQAARTPEQLAFACGARTLTYAQLNARSNRLAHWLVRHGVERDVRVGVSLSRTLDLPVVLLGILKSGGAYVPLDPALPAARRQFIERDAAVAFVVVDEANDAPPSAGVAPRVRCEAVTVDADLPTHDLHLPVPSNSLAYVIYTSGSTGQPKGVMVEHGNVDNFVAAMSRVIDLSPRSAWLAVSAASFDISVLELLWTSAMGMPVVLDPGLAHWAAGQAAPHGPRGQPITHLQCTPSGLRVLLAQAAGRALLAGLQHLLIGGEALPAELARRARELVRGRITNMYGPTETTVWSSCFELGESEECVPIGHPISNTVLAVVDEHGRLQPRGAIGELWIGGAGVARGYVDRPQLDAERFVSGVPLGEPALRMYRTGDLVRQRSDAAFEFLGRIDTQVKVRGHRVELGEIEVALGQHAGLEDCCVVLHEGHGDAARLVAYVVPVGDAPVEPRELLAHLVERVPSYMLPEVFVALARLPLNVNGKLDRQALPEPPAAISSESECVAPTSELEHTLAAVWREVFGRATLSVTRDFFADGGDSLLGVRLADAAAARGLPISVRDLFVHRTIRDLAAFLERDATRADATNLAAEVELSQDTCSKLQLTSPVAAREGVFMTGATGFLGAFLLDELTRDSTQTIHCLVRAASQSEALQRLRDNLAGYGLDPERVLRHVRVVTGALDAPTLGLSTQRYAQLASECGVVLHNAAEVNFVYPYERLRPSNVDGTRAVIDFAATGRRKELHFVSTIAVAPAGLRASFGAPVSEHAPLDDWSALEDGYSQSKWVAEQLVRLAARAGLPVAIYRPGRILGHSVTGFVPQDDAIVRAIASIVQLGCGFSSRGLALHDLCQVDVVARAIKSLLHSGAGVDTTLHLTNPQPVAVATFYDWLRAFGYAVTELRYPAWRELIREAGSATPFYALLQYMPTASAEARLQPQVRCEHSTAVLRAHGVSWPPFEAATLHAMLRRLIEAGLIAAPSQPGLAQSATAC